VADILVIGYGNELRGDDGIGPRVAEVVAATNYPDVRVVRCFQLVPELAADLAQVQRVIFVDGVAEARKTAVEVRSLSPAETTDWSTHVADPRTLLALAQALYGRMPEAWYVLVSGENFDFGEGLSSAACDNVQKAGERIRKLIVDCRAGGRSPCTSELSAS